MDLIKVPDFSCLMSLLKSSKDEQAHIMNFLWGVSGWAGNRCCVLCLEFMHFELDPGQWDSTKLPADMLRHAWRDSELFTGWWYLVQWQSPFMSISPQFQNHDLPTFCSPPWKLFFGSFAYLQPEQSWMLYRVPHRRICPNLGIIEIITVLLDTLRTFNITQRQQSMRSKVVQVNLRVLGQTWKYRTLSSPTMNTLDGLKKLDKTIPSEDEFLTILSLYGKDLRIWQCVLANRLDKSAWRGM